MWISVPVLRGSAAELAGRDLPIDPEVHFLYRGTRARGQ